MLALWNDDGNRMTATMHWRGGFLLPEPFFPVEKDDLLHACLEGEPPFTIRVVKVNWPACYYSVTKAVGAK